MITWCLRFDNNVKYKQKTEQDTSRRRTVEGTKKCTRPDATPRCEFCQRNQASYRHQAHQRREPQRRYTQCADDAVFKGWPDRGNSWTSGERRSRFAKSSYQSCYRSKSQMLSTPVARMRLHAREFVFWPEITKGTVTYLWKNTEEDEQYKETSLWMYRITPIGDYFSITIRVAVQQKATILPTYIWKSQSISPRSVWPTPRTQLRVTK